MYEPATAKTASASAVTEALSANSGIMRGPGSSEKTIRNDIKAINAYLHMNEVTSRIQTKGSGKTDASDGAGVRSMSISVGTRVLKSSRIWTGFITA